MKKIVLILFALLFNLSCSQKNIKHITEVSQEELKNVVLIDVRTPEEYADGHLENALNINWFDADFGERFKGIDKEETIYLYCKAGGRSAKALAKLEGMGYQNVVNLDGGYQAWAAQKK